LPVRDVYNVMGIKGKCITEITQAMRYLLQ
jgi:hypothetical protein